MKDSLRQSYRVSLVTALSLAFAYGFKLDFPYLAPLLAFMLAASSQQPMKMKAMVGLLLLIALTLGTGLMLIPMLDHFNVTGLILVFLGIYLSTHITVNLGKVLVGTFFLVGMTLLSIVGTMSFAAASTLLDTILLSVICAVVCQWIVFPFFPLEPAAEATPDSQKAENNAEDSSNKDAGKWIAIRTTVIVFPVYLLALTNPGLYLPLIMKAASLGQQTTELNVQKAGNELLLSTLMAGVLAIAFWILLQFWPSLWMFFLLTLLFGLIVNRYMFGVSPSRFAPSFWQNALITMLLLIGPAVQDTVNGKDVYKAFAVRISLFIAVSLYAWYAARLLEAWRRARLERRALAV